MKTRPVPSNRWVMSVQSLALSLWFGFNTVNWRQFVFDASYLRAILIKACFVHSFAIVNHEFCLSFVINFNTVEHLSPIFLDVYRI